MEREPTVKELKKLIRLSYKSFYYMSIFLIVPTIGYYFFKYDIIMWARDIGIVILFMSLWRITKRMKKKELEETK